MQSVEQLLKVNFVIFICDGQISFFKVKETIFFVCFLFPDPEYKKFLEYYNGDEEKFTSSPEILLEELEAKSKELVGRKC